MDTPCTDSSDATCVCDYGYYLNKLSQECQPCTRCPEGQGMLLSCGLDHDTMCEECTVDTYSDQESFREPCIPCTTCDDGELLQACTSVSDTVCQGETSSWQRLIGKSTYGHSVLVCTCKTGKTLGVFSVLVRYNFGQEKQTSVWQEADEGILSTGSMDMLAMDRGSLAPGCSLLFMRAVLIILSNTGQESK